MKKTFVATLHTIWISFTELIRNQFLLQCCRMSHYTDMRLTYSAGLQHGAIRYVWRIIFDKAFFFPAKHDCLIACTAPAWLIAFGMRRLVTGNLKVMPFTILSMPTPLGILEAAAAARKIPAWKNTTEHLF